MKKKRSRSRFVGDWSELKFHPRTEPNYYQRRLSEFKPLIESYQSNEPNILIEGTTLRSTEAHTWLKTIEIVHNLQLSDINITDAEIKKLVMIDCQVTGINFTNSEIEQFILIRTDISNAKFNYARMNQVIMSEVIARNINFSNAYLNNSWLEGDFSGCQFTNATLQKTILKGNFTRTQFDYADMENSWLREVDIKKSSFIGANIKGMINDLVAPGVHSVTMPDGSLHEPIFNDFYKFSKR
jgi:uncharacterized protein YjbI with pentapeptide repeats